MSQRTFEGGCLCRSIRYRIAGMPLAQSLCHCVSCRLAAGAPAVARIVANRGDFVLLSGEPLRFPSSPPVVRTSSPEPLA